MESSRLKYRNATALRGQNLCRVVMRLVNGLIHFIVFFSIFKRFSFSDIFQLKFSHLKKERNFFLQNKIVFFRNENEDMSPQNTHHFFWCVCVCVCVSSNVHLDLRVRSEKKIAQLMHGQIHLPPFP